MIQTNNHQKRNHDVEGAGCTTSSVFTSAIFELHVVPNTISIASVSTSDVVLFSVFEKIEFTILVLLVF
jgi:hypothetical protein